MQHLLCYLRPIPLLILLIIGLSACEEREAPLEKQGPATTPTQPGMRAYVDPVTGEYTSPPPPDEEEKSTPAGAAATVSPEPSPPEEVTVPKGGVMIELGDHIQVEQKTTD